MSNKLAFMYSSALARFSCVAVIASLFATSCDDEMSMQDEDFEDAETPNEVETSKPGADEIAITPNPAALTCNGSGSGNVASCNGKDPAAYGCTVGAVTPTNAKKYIYDEWSGTALGYVEMKYSKNCNAQWGEVYSYQAYPYSKVALRSTDGKITYSAPLYKYNTSRIRTTMRATPNPGYKVDGGIDFCNNGCDSGGYSWVIW